MTSSISASNMGSSPQIYESLEFQENKKGGSIIEGLKEAISDIFSSGPIEKTLHCRRSQIPGILKKLEEGETEFALKIAKCDNNPPNAEFKDSDDRTGFVKVNQGMADNWTVYELEFNKSSDGREALKKVYYYGDETKTVGLFPVFQDNYFDHVTEWDTKGNVTNMKRAALQRDKNHEHSKPYVMEVHHDTAKGIMTCVLRNAVDGEIKSFK